jgi:hypothetical protein
VHFPAGEKQVFLLFLNSGLVSSKRSNNNVMEPQKESSIKATAAATASTTNATTMPFTNKKKRKADSLARIGCSLYRSTNSGRGRVAGWTPCPLCHTSSSTTTTDTKTTTSSTTTRPKKQFALGRGIAEHLHAVHAPWRTRTNKNADDANPHDESSGDRQRPQQEQPQEPQQQEPTDAERDDWEAQVVEIVAALERAAADQTRGLDRCGNTTRPYGDSLPEFLKAAAAGDRTRLQSMVAVAEQQDDIEDGGGANEKDSKRRRRHLLTLLDTCDRHKSIAEHWAAGGGHLDCLKYLLALRDKLAAVYDDHDDDNDDKETHNDDDNNNNNNKKRRKIGRRDGKTSLHYACRNGRLECVRYLVEERRHDVNEVSGDGTTPLHLACFGAHTTVVTYLLAQGAHAHQINDWQCSAAHWVAMSRCEDRTALWAVCNCLRRDHNVSFTARQGHGHTPLHKAAQKLNRHVIEWFLADDEDGGVDDSASAATDYHRGAGLSPQQWQEELAQQRDQGGHLPSDLWQNAKGDDETLQKLQARGC